MPTSKKKKKAATNPARGFTTVSLPSRASAARQENDISESQEPTSQGRLSAGIGNATNSEGDQPKRMASSVVRAPNILDMSPEQLEEHLRGNELQSFLDAHGSKCKTDALKQVARLETERRTLRLQAIKISTSTWLPEQLVDDILQDFCIAPTSEKFTSALRTDEPEHDLLLKLWTLHQVLSKFSFPAVEQVLLHVLQLSHMEQIFPAKEDIWGLSEALDWYALHACDYYLANYDYIVPKARNEIQSPVSNQVTGEIRPDHPIESSTSEESHLIVAENPVTAESPAVSVSGFADQSSENPTVITSENLGQENHAAPKPLQKFTGPSINDTEPEYESVENGEPETQTDSEDDSDPEGLVRNYIKLKSRLLTSTLKGNTSTISQSRRQKLEDRTKRIERDILFDKGTAEATWRDLQPKLLADLAKQRLPDRSETIMSNLEKQEKNETSETDERPTEGIGLYDMFGDVDSPAESSNTNQENSVTLVDYGTWKGAHPKKLLEEQCKLRDVHCRIVVRLVSSSSFAFRHSVSIKWSSDQGYDLTLGDALPPSVSHCLRSKTVDLEMRTVATPSKIQSEAYICTLALFIVAMQSSTGTKMQLRLPPVFRDIWADLVQARTEAVDESDRSILKRLQAWIEETRSSHNDATSSSTAEISEKQENLPLAVSVQQRSTSTFTTEQATSEWTRRASTASFQAMLRTRRDLPIHTQKDRILETVKNARITIICAETGAGKSTQVPSYILENELKSGRDCRVLVTQPRRISAVSLARRVSQELGERVSSLGTRDSLVGYAIRLEAKTSSTTRITFATTGVLLRILENSPNLDEVDYVILDEVHERTMDLDCLFIAIRRAIVRRPSLKLVLMSATIDAERLSKYFGDAPILDIAGRTYPVEVGFLEDAIEACIDHMPAHKWKTQSQGDAEDEEVSSDAMNSQQHKADNLQGYSSEARAFLSAFNEHRINYDFITKLLYAISTDARYKKYSSAILVFMPGLAEIRKLRSTILSERAFQSDWIIHLLHSSFSTNDLERAFAPPPRDSRKIVIATNIAETGVTIPDVTAVIDTCKEKVLRFDERRQVSKLVEGYVSRSSSRQRRGRAARVQPGICFHLVTKYRFENLMPVRHVPEMLRLSLQEPILRIKVWDLGEIEETLLAAVDPPTTKSIRRAIEALKDVGALTSSENLTPLGRQLARLPLNVELGKLCLLGIVFRCLDPAVTITAILSSKSPFTSSQESRNQLGQSTGSKDNASDLLWTYGLYQGWRRAKISGSAAEFCWKHSLNEQNLSQIEDQRISVFVSLVDARLISLDESEKSVLKLSRLHNSALGFFSVPERYQVAAERGDAICAVIAMAFYPKVLGREGKNWRNVLTNQHVHLNWNSATISETGYACWVSYYQALQTKSGRINVTGTAKLPEFAICLLLGQAEFRPYSGVVKIDGSRIKMAIRDWRSLLAIKVLRNEISSIFSRFLQSPGRTLTEREETWFRSWLRVVSARRE